MADNGLLVGSCGVIVAIILKRRKRRRRNRKVWTREWIRKRDRHGAYHQLLQELKLCDRNAYKNFLRIDEAIFETILELVSPIISRQDTHLRQSISAGERLAVTLRFLATGIYIRNTLKMKIKLYSYRRDVCQSAVRV